MEEVFRRLDVLISPTHLSPAPKLEPVRSIESKEDAFKFFMLRRGGGAPAALTGGPAAVVVLTEVP